MDNLANMENVSEVEMDISEQQNIYSTLSLIFLGVAVAVGTFGILTNCLTIFIFLKMGLSDGVTVNFFGLAIADLGVTVTAALAALSDLSGPLLEVAGFGFLPMDPKVVSALTYNTMTAFSQGTQLLTTYLSIQRCCCVIMPFRFRRIFSKNVTLFIVYCIGIITSFFVAAFASLYAVEWRPMSDFSNRSYLGLVPRPHRNLIIQFLLTYSLLVCPLTCESIVLVCLVVMLGGLKQAAAFKTSAALADNEVKQPANDSSGKDQKSNSSEVKVMKTVILIATLFVISNIPGNAMALTRLFTTRFRQIDSLRNADLLFFRFNHLAITLNSTLNFFIYLKSSSKFNSVFKSYFSPESDSK